MSDWASLFHSLTVDTLDTVDTLSAAKGRYVKSVNTVQSVNVSEGERQDAPTPSPLTTDTLDTADTLSTARVDAGKASTAERCSVNTVQSVNMPEGERGAAMPPLVAALAALERHCPDHIEARDWQHAVEDGRRFLIQWGQRATALGWVEADVFGLPPVLSNPHPSWRRLSRVDQLGLVWLTHGRPVTSITAESATIATPGGGSLTFYRSRACVEPSPRDHKDEKCFHCGHPGGNEVYFGADLIRLHRECEEPYMRRLTADEGHSLGPTQRSDG